MKTTMYASRRQVLAGGIAAAALATLAACGSDKKDTSATGGSDTTGGSDAAGSGEVVKITYWHRLPDKEGMTKVNDVVAQWNQANPGIQVTAKKFDGKADESYAKIAQAVKSGDAPDLAQVGYGEIAAEFLAGDLEDVAAQFKEGGYEKNYAAGPMAQCKLDSVVVGLPQDTGPLVYIYDKAAFDALGIKVPTTWAELKEAAKTAKASGKYIASWQGDEVGYLMSGQAAAAGASWYTPEGTTWKVDCNSEISKKVATVYQELLDEGLIFVPSDGRWGDAFGAALKDGSLIGTVAAGWEPGFILGDLGVTETKWQVAYLPKFDGVTKDATGADGGSAVAVIKGCKHPAEALKFADWFNQQIPALVSQGLVVAATTGKPETPEALKKLWGGQDVFGFLAEANATMNPNFPYAPTWPKVTSAMAEVGGNVTLGSAKVADIFSKAQETSLTTLKAQGISAKE